jgi:hypothetical protein
MHHHPGCAASEKGRCDCPCGGSHHGVRKGKFANEAKKRLTDLITANVPELVDKPRAKRTREIRDTFTEDAGSWLADVVSGETRGAVIDDLAEAISDALTESGASWRLGEEHLLCEIFTQMYLCRAVIEKAVAAGVGKLVDDLAEILAAGLDDTLPDASATRSEFVNALRDKLADEPGKRLVSVVLAHVGYPTPEQLVVLIMLLCPDPTPKGHPAAAKAVIKTGIPTIMDAAVGNP